MSTDTEEKVYWLETKTFFLFVEHCYKNEEVYRSGDFDAFFTEHSSSLRDIGITVQLDKLSTLTGKSDSDVEDAWIIFSALNGMTPSIACHGEIWAHLTHTHLLDFGRKRWIKPSTAKSDIETHFCKYTAGKLRDDHASSRGWWLAYIASRIADSKEEADIKEVLKYTARTTDTRQATIERPHTFSDTYLANGIVKKVKHTPDYNSPASEKPFRNFIIQTGLRSNGKTFIDFSDDEIINFLS